MPRPPLPSSRPARSPIRILHTRLAIALVVADLPPSPEIAQALHRESAKPENFGDKWLGRAFYIAATRHQDNFLTAYKSDKAAVPFAALPVPLRLGNFEAGLAPPRSGGDRGRLEGHPGAGRMGDARASRLRRCGVVHADDRLERRPRAGDGVVRPGSEHSRGVGQRSLDSVYTAGAGRRAWRRTRWGPPLHGSRRHAAAWTEHDHRSDSERPWRGRIHRRAGSDVHRRPWRE